MNKIARRGLTATEIKWIALITMTIDHIGYFLYPQLILLRMIGRLSFPLYAYLIVEGYLHTRNRLHYGIRMLVFAIAAQMLFIAFDITFVNVLFTFVLGMIALYGKERNWLVVTLLALFVAWYFNTDYSYYGVATIILFYIFREKRLYALWSFALLTMYYTFSKLFYQPALLSLVFNNFMVYYSFFIQILALLSLPLLWMYNGEKSRTKRHTSLKHTTTMASKDEKKSVISSWLSQYFFYLYYPAHLIILALLQGGQ